MPETPWSTSSRHHSDRCGPNPGVGIRLSQRVILRDQLCLGLSPSPLLSMGRVRTARNSTRFCEAAQMRSPSIMIFGIALLSKDVQGCDRWSRRRMMLVSARMFAIDSSHPRTCRCCLGSWSDQREPGCPKFPFHLTIERVAWSTATFSCRPVCRNRFLRS